MSYTIRHKDFLYETDEIGKYYKATRWKCRISEKNMDKRPNGSTCMILYMNDEITIENLESDTRGYGTILLTYVLKYLDENHSNIPIRLFDVSTIKLNAGRLPLSVITILTKGKFSWYSKFGFKPCDIKSHGVSNTSVDLEYQKEYDKASLRRCKYMDKYQWISTIIDCLRSSSLSLMTEALEENKVDYNYLAMYGDQVASVLEKIFGINGSFDVKWCRIT